MKKLLAVLIGVSLGTFSTLSQAENLLQIYQQARLTNPDLRSSAAERDKAFEKISEARSPLLPQLNLGGDYKYNNGFRASRGYNNNTLSGALQLDQTIFDLSKWRLLTLQEKRAGIQDVTYQSAQQKLILDSTTAYFNVLRAIDTLSFTEAQKQSIYRQLDQTTQRFNVGLVAITDVQNARAKYDSVLANEVSARNNLDNTLEILRQITGNYYVSLASLDINSFKTDKPESIAGLLKQVERRNLNLLTARLNQDLARESIRQYQAGHLPTLGLTASTGLVKKRYSYGNSMPNEPFLNTNNINGTNAVGLSLTLPLFSGGAVSSQVKQAQYDFVSASEQLESAHRLAIQLARSSYNNLKASVSSITAYRQAVISAQSSLNAMEASYKVGTRTIVDVLDATTTLYNARQQLSSARYDYLINWLNIKQAEGTLNEKDLIILNRMLGKDIPTSANVVAPEDFQQQQRADYTTPGFESAHHVKRPVKKAISATNRYSKPAQN